MAKMAIRETEKVSPKSKLQLISSRQETDEELMKLFVFLINFMVKTV